MVSGDDAALHVQAAAEIDVYAAADIGGVAAGDRAARERQRAVHHDDAAHIHRLAEVAVKCVCAKIERDILAIGDRQRAVAFLSEDIARQRDHRAVLRRVDSVLQDAPSHIRPAGGDGDVSGFREDYALACRIQLIVAFHAPAGKPHVLR